MTIELAAVDEQPPFANLTTLVPDWDVPSHVTAFTTTRLGGVSAAPYHSLNLGLHVGDDAGCVEENRRRLGQSMSLPNQPHWLVQTHGDTVVQIDEVLPQGELLNADGAWTHQHHAVLAVLTADCLPVVLSNSQGDRVAVVHAGWRGLAQGILAQALAAFSEADTVHAWLGPAIGAEKFEVGEEVREAFVRRQACHENAFRAAKSPGKYFADIYQLARHELTQHRQVSLSGGDYCTHTQQSWFHSHRRDGVQSGRMATLAWLSPA